MLIICHTITDSNEIPYAIQSHISISISYRNLANRITKLSGVRINSIVDFIYYEMQRCLYYNQSLSLI